MADNIQFNFHFGPIVGPKRKCQVFCRGGEVTVEVSSSVRLTFCFPLVCSVCKRSFHVSF